MGNPIIKKVGKIGGGTWIHQRLILNLARWLDVEFEIWCDEVLGEKYPVARNPVTVIKGGNPVFQGT